MMKKLLISIFAIMALASVAYAQTPNNDMDWAKGFNYQMVVRNSSGQLVSNKEVSVRIRIAKESTPNDPVYQFSTNLTTNANGLVTMVIGRNADGQVAEGYRTIKWKEGPYRLLVDVDPEGHGNYILNTSQRIFSVPFAEYAVHALTVDSSWLHDEEDPLFNRWYTSINAYDSINGRPTHLSQFVNDLNLSDFNNDLNLSDFNNDLNLSDFNNDLTLQWDSIIGRPTNLSQFINDLAMSFHGDTLFVGGNSVVLPSTEWDSIINHPTNLSQFVNDLNLSDFNNDLNLSDFNNDLNLSNFNNDLSLSDFNNDLTIEWDSVLNHPTNLSQFVNDLNLSDFNNDLTIEWDSVLNHPTNLSQFVNDLNLSDFNNDLTIEWDSVLNHPTNLSQFVNDLNLSDFNNDLNLTDFNNDLTIEWDSVLNHPTNLSQFNNDIRINWDSIEGRPTDLSQFVNNLRVDWDSITNRPTNLSQFVNDLNLSDFNNDLTLSYSGDTLYVGGNSVVLDIEWDSILNHPTNLSQFVNDLNLSDFNNDLNLSDFNNDLNLTDFNNDLTIEWDSVLNHPTNLSQFNNDIRINWDSIDGRPTDLSQFVNNLRVDWDSITNRPTNLSQFVNDLNLSDFNNDLTLSYSGDTLYVGGNSVVLDIEWDSILNHPTNLSQFVNDLNLSDFNNDLNLSDFNNDLNLTDFTNDLTIEWDSVLNHPTNLSQFVNDLNLSDFNNDLNLSDFNNDITLADVMANGNSANGLQITNVGNPIVGTDAVNKYYVDNNLNAVRNELLDSISGLRGDLNQLRDDISDSLTVLRGDLSNLRNEMLDSLNGLNLRLDSLAAAMNNALAAMDSAHQAQLDSLKDALFDMQHERIDGELNGVFSVSPNKKVRFSQGNMQYNPRKKTWRFAANQYSLAGNDNNNVGLQAYCTYWLDLFGYGTSGWDGGANNYQPYATGVNDQDYNELGSSLGEPLTGLRANADWGFFNPVVNGGNQMGTWRTMTYSEWKYVLSDRNNAANLRGCATVDGVAGYVLLPDTWVSPTGITFVNDEGNYSTNSYNAAQWSTMEAAGAVFLPAAGQRNNVTTTNVGTVGNYWSATNVNVTTSLAIQIVPSAYGPGAIPANTANSQGCSVRCVRDYK